MREREGALVVESRGTMAVGGAHISWYTAQPDPAHWVAVGSFLDAGLPPPVRIGVVVGAGRSETEATGDLLRQAQSALAAAEQLLPPLAAEWVAEWTL